MRGPRDLEAGESSERLFEPVEVDMRERRAGKPVWSPRESAASAKAAREDSRTRGKRKGKSRERGEREAPWYPRPRSFLIGLAIFIGLTAVAPRSEPVPDPVPWKYPTEVRMIAVHPGDGHVKHHHKRERGKR